MLGYLVIYFSVWIKVVSWVHVPRILVKLHPRLASSSSGISLVFLGVLGCLLNCVGSGRMCTPEGLTIVDITRLFRLAEPTLPDLQLARDPFPDHFSIILISLRAHNIKPTEL